MLAKTQSYISANGLFTPGDTVLVAVSGGADSIALLDILSRLRDWPLTLVVAHLNHQLRGSESDGDEAFVCSLAASLGIRCHVRSVDVKAFGRQHGLSLEEAGRICRYRFFGELAADYGAKVALAHHRDDQAETVLMRLLRGSAGSGLSGMSSKSADGRYVRPLLTVTRREIEEYLRERGLTHRVDASNDDTAFLRNRVRHELLPLLQTYNPAVADLLCSTATSLAADEEALEGIVAEFLQRHGALSAAKVHFSSLEIRGLKKGLRMRLYRAALRHVKGDLRKVGAVHLDDIDRIVHDPKPHQNLTLPDGIIVGTSYERIVFTTADAVIADEEYSVPIAGAGTYHLPNDFVVDVRVGNGSEPAAGGVWSASFDLAEVPFPWTARSFRDGDRMIPFGMTGRKKVKAIFQECRVPREERRRIPLLFCGETLLWIPGIRRSSSAPVGVLSAAVVTVSVAGREASNNL